MRDGLQIIMEFEYMNSPVPRKYLDRVLAEDSAETRTVLQAVRDTVCTSLFEVDQLGAQSCNRPTSSSTIHCYRTFKGLRNG